MINEMLRELQHDSSDDEMLREPQHDSSVGMASSSYLLLAMTTH